MTGELPLGRFSLPSEKASVNNQLDDVVLRTLQKEPARRYQQASDIKLAVDSIARNSSTNSIAQSFRGQPGPKEHSRAEFDHDMSSSSEEAILCTLPFSISDLYWGMACAYGIVHLDETGIELEYEVLDEVFGTVKSAAKQVRVPLRNIVSIEFIKGIFSDRVEIQTNRLDISKEVPNSKQACFQLGTKRADADRARNFVEEVKRLKGIDSPADRRPAPPVKSAGSRGSLTTQDVANSLQYPRMGFLAAAWINLISATAGLLQGVQWKAVSPLLVKIDWLPVLDFETIPIPLINFASLITLCFAIWLFVLAGKMRRQTDFTFVLVSAVLLLPLALHPAYGLTLIFSIWTLVVLSDQRVRLAFGSPGPRLAGSSERGFSLDSFRASTLRLLLFLGVVGICLLGTLSILFIVFRASTKTNEKPAPESGFGNYG